MHLQCVKCRDDSDILNLKKMYLTMSRLAIGLGLRCASGCVVECWICNREVAGSNLSLGYFAPSSTQPSIPLGSVNQYQLWLGRQRTGMAHSDCG